MIDLADPSERLPGIHIDHRVPRSKGGSLASSNLVVACSDCNYGKKDVLLEEHAKAA